MASYGLVANPSKTTLMIINGKKEEELEIVIDGSSVKQTKNPRQSFWSLQLQKTKNGTYK